MWSWNNIMFVCFENEPGFHYESQRSETDRSEENR